MTDHNREELIEKAAKALYLSQWHDGNYERTAEFNKDAWRAHARAALAVFEQAHTPTRDDEEPGYEWAIRSRIKREYSIQDNLPSNRGWPFWRTGLSEETAYAEAAGYAPGYEVEVVRRRKAGPWAVAEQGDAS